MIRYLVTIKRNNITVANDVMIDAADLKGAQRRSEQLYSLVTQRDVKDITESDSILISPADVEDNTFSCYTLYSLTSDKPHWFTTEI